VHRLAACSTDPVWSDTGESCGWTVPGVHHNQPPQPAAGHSTTGEFY